MLVTPQYSPMAPTLIREPFHRPAWIYEEKVDGWRMLAYKDGQRVRLVSRKGVEHTRRFADLARRRLNCTPEALASSVARWHLT